MVLGIVVRKQQITIDIVAGGVQAQENENNSTHPVKRVELKSTISNLPQGTQGQKRRHDEFEKIKK